MSLKTNPSSDFGLYPVEFSLYLYSIDGAFEENGSDIFEAFLAENRAIFTY